MSEPSSREIALVESDQSDQSDQPERFNRWAVIVGISKYQDSNLNLQYAERDAEALYQLLLTPTGGHFQKDFICKLTNKAATTGSIVQALRGFLKKPAREDLVILYFACHGAPDPERPENVYLLTHDTNPTDIAGTALPVGDINRALKDTLISEKVIILADTCHSAAIGGGIRSRGLDESTALINQYLREISTSRGGTALLTSAEAHEVSFEDKKWGGGHGVFTYYLLEGLKGAADVNANGFVTVGELFEYVRENVKNATNHKQHPSIGTNPFDRNLPLAITTNSSHSSQKLLKSNSLLLSPSAPKKRLNPLLLVSLCLAVSIAGVSFFLMNGRTDSDSQNKTTEVESDNRTENLGLESPGLESPRTESSGTDNPFDVRISETIATASSLEKAALDQLAIKRRENLDLASDNWQEAIDLLSVVVSENKLSPSSKAGRKLEEYRNRLLYTNALKEGLAAGDMISRKVPIATELDATVDITSADCRRVIELWQSALAKLNQIPEVDPNYVGINEKIAEYTDKLGYAKKKEIIADYLRAVQIANAANDWSKTAKTADHWIKISDLWSQAAELMQKVPDEPKSHKDTAQDRIPKYQNNEINALQKAGSS